MFYANFVLAKKGPLAKVWLAAHWEKKLSKAQVFETDLKSTVESIISPQVKIALRTSSHLLLGVVRIYSRKTKYLLADCTEALIKIKMSFRPEAVDLPLDNQKATVASITLPEFQEWDALVDNIGKFDYTKNKNQCRIEDITMKEDVLNPRFLSDDNFFGDTPFGETSREVMRDEVSIDQSMQLQADLSKISDVTMKDKHDVTNQSLKDLDAMMLEDGGFGAGEGLDFMEDFNIDGQITGLEDPQLTGLEDAQITGLEDLDKDLEPLEKTALGEEDGDKTLVNGEEQVLEEKADVVVEEPEALHAPMECIAPMEVDQTVPPDHTVPDITELGTAELPTAVETTMFTRASENLALDPIEETIKGKGKKKNRKRKLVVDNEKIIDSVTFKKQLQNYEDLVKKATVAPPTKIRMKLYDSSVKSLYSHPCSHKYPRAVAQWYSDNQTATVPEDFVLQSSQEDELELEQIPQEQQHEVADIEVARDAQEHNPDEQQLVLVNGELEEVEKTRDNESEFPALPEEEQFVGVMDPLEEQPLNEDEVNFAPPFVEEPQEVPAEVEKTLNTTSELESEFESSATESGPSKKRWTKRSQQTLNAIEKTTNKTGLATVNFNTEILGRKCSRKQAALKFYTLLMLNKEKAIRIKQDEVFSDIHLEKGVNFRKCLAH